MEAIRLDSSRWPVVIVTPSDPFTDADIDDFLVRYEALVNGRREPYATVVDLRKCKDMSPTQRKRITNGMEKNKELRAKYQRGFALVFESALLKMLLTAILWANKPEYELKVFNDLTLALGWANMMVKASRPLAKTG